MTETTSPLPPAGRPRAVIYPAPFLVGLVLALAAVACSDDGPVASARTKAPGAPAALVRLVERLRPEHVEQSPLLGADTGGTALPDGVSVVPLAGLPFGVADFGGLDGPAPDRAARGRETTDIFRTRPPALEITASEPRSATLRINPVPVKPETSYTFVGWLQATDVEAVDNARSASFLLEERSAQGRVTWRATPNHQGSTDGWVRQSLTFTTEPRANEIIVHGALGANGFAAGTVHFDDMVLVQHAAGALSEERLADLLDEAVRAPWRLETRALAEGTLGRDDGWALDAALPVKRKLRLGREVRSALMAPVPSRFAIPVTLPDDAVLEVDLGLRHRLSLPADAEVAYHVRLERDGRTVTVLEDVLTGGQDEAWEPRRIPLPGGPGPARLILETHGPDELALAPAVWGHPVVRGTTDGRPPRRVVLVSLDTLRADHLGAYGHDYDTSPFLDGLARRGVLFEQVLSPAPFTLPSHVTMMTGLAPETHHVFFEASRRLDSDITTLAEALQQAGFITAGFHGGGLLDPAYGFAEGFDLYRHGKHFDDSLDEAVRFMAEHADEDVFVFLHTYRIHAPYEVLVDSLEQFDSPYDVLVQRLGDADPEELGSIHYMGRFIDPAQQPPDAHLEMIELLYDAGIRSADAAVAGFFARLEAAGLQDDTLVVVTSDHGDEFEEHGGFLHGHALYNELLHVPLIIAGAPDVAAGRRVPDVVGTVDLMPTVLELLDVPAPDDLDGRSLLPLMRGGPEAGGPSGDLSASVMRLDHRLFAITSAEHKYIYDAAAGTEELYDIRRDFAEQENLALQDALLAEQYRERLRPRLSRLPGVHLAFRNDGRYETLSGSVAFGGGAPEIRRFFLSDADEARYDPETGRVHFRIALGDGLSWLNLESGQPPEMLELHVELDGEPVPAALVSAGSAPLPDAGTGARAWRLRVEDLAVTDGSDPAGALGLHVWAHGSAAPDGVTLDAEQLERLRELGYIR